MKHRTKIELQPLLKGVPWESLGVRPPRPVVYGVDKRRQDFERGRSKKQIKQVLERVVVLRAVTGKDLIAAKGGDKATLEARSLAMAACAAVGVPLCHIARTFNRNWATVYTAERKNAERYRANPEFRKEWDSIVKGLH